MNRVVSWVIKLINQNQLEQENDEHDIELNRVFKNTILEDISENDNFVQKNELSQVHGGLPCLLLGNGEQEFLFGVLQLEGQQVLGSFD